MSVCTCVESSYYSTLPCNLQPLNFECAHITTEHIVATQQK